MNNFNLEHILESNKGKIYRICRIYAVTPIEPEDLFQEVAFQIWKSLPSFKGQSNIDTWVYRITLNVCLRSKLKLEKQTSKTVRFDAIEFKASENVSDKDDEKYVFLKACISSLNDSDKALVIMYLEEFSYQHIAEVLGISENHVAVKIKRVRKKLFDCINPKLK